MEQVPLLATKLYIPPVRPELVSRPRLIERLNAGLPTRDVFPRALTLVSAPAGFGKTTLISEWVHAAGTHRDAPQVAWLSLDAGDNDLTRFLSYLIAALRTLALSEDGTSAVEGIEPRRDPVGSRQGPAGHRQDSVGHIGKGALSALASPQPPPAEVVLTSLINEIAALPDRITLVLDDYHLIEAQPIHDALSFLLEHQPPQMHLVIATRDDPHLPFARLRARGQLTELRASDLRFTSSEAAEFLKQVMGLDLSADDIAALERRTEGWITGLHLAALALQGTISMRGHKGAASFIKSFTGSHRFVLDYLVEEVLEQQSAIIQSFLLQTAILDRLTGPLCDAVCFGVAESADRSARAPSGEEDGQATLDMLERANLFIVPLDEERRWYRYHHLFSDLLRQRLRQTQPEELPILHVRAAEWFAHQGLNREAIKHMLAAGDYQGAAELIRAIAIDIIQLGEHTTVGGWIKALPEELVKEQPYLCVLHAWALMLIGQLETAEARLFDAESALESPKHQHDEDADTILGLVHSHRAYLAVFMGEHDKTIFYAQQALDQLPETAALIRAQTALYLGFAYRFRGQVQAAMDVINKTLPITQRMGGSSVAVLCYLNLGLLYADMAQLRRAKETYEEALRITERHTGRPDLPYTGYVYVCIGRILREWNQLEDAYRYTTKGVALARDWKVAEVMGLSCLELASIHWALGRAEQARASFQEAIQVYCSFSPWGTMYAGAHQVKFDLARGDIDAAGRWAQENDLAIDGEFQFHREVEYVALARIFIAQQRLEEAHALLKRQYRVTRETGRRQTELEALILLAIVFSAQGETDQALDYLEKALSSGEPEGYIRIFVDEGPPMARLLYEALSRGIAPNYVQRLLAAFEDATKDERRMTAPSSVVGRPSSALVEPLSERELEVLQLIAEGLTNREIAARLFLALNTIKSHTRNIYGKLGVSSRTQAVARAKTLGILTSN